MSKAKTIVSKPATPATTKPALSPEDQKVWVGSTLGSLGDRTAELAVHLEDLGTLLYEREQTTCFGDNDLVLQAASTLLNQFSQDIKGIAKEMQDLGRIAEARGVDDAQRGGGK